jgi:hypothetical protein
MIATINTTQDRVRKHTAPEVNRRIEENLELRLDLYSRADRSEIARRIEELDREWDIERVLETNAATLALTGTLLGMFAGRKWLLLPALVTGFLLQHAIQGWCPPLPLLRRLGVRTRTEIEKERYALKAMRGDFGGSFLEQPLDPNQLLHSLDQ